MPLRLLFHDCQLLKALDMPWKSCGYQATPLIRHVLPDRYHNGNCQIPKIARQLAPAQTESNNARHAQS